MQKNEMELSDSSSAHIDADALLQLFKKVEVDGLASIDSLARDFPGSSDQILSAIDSIRWVQDHLHSRTLSAAHCGNSVKQPDELPSKQFGDYLIYQPIGSGGMGTIFFAWQISLNRPVAIKMLRSDIPNNTAEQFRFRAEALAAASLNHPNIVSIYDVGVVDGQPYYAMQYIEGKSLAQCAATTPLRTTIGWLIPIASAVSAAHERGILHRDIKPSNILIDSQGRPSLIDFGLAQYLTPFSSDKTESSAAGTVDYMSPEQAVGAKYLTVESDIFSLGVVLYELLTGIKPFQAATKIETLTNIVTLRPKPPHLTRHSATHRQASDRDLSEVCLKALAKDPRERYRSMDQFASDLRNWLEGVPVIARKVSPARRTIRWFARRPLVAALAILLLTISVSSMFSLVHLWKQRTLALEDLETLNAKTQQSLYANQLSRAVRHIDENALPAARKQLLECEQSSRGWEWNLLYRSTLEGRTCVSFPIDNEPVASTWTNEGKFRTVEAYGTATCFANNAGTFSVESKFELGENLQHAAIAPNELCCVCRWNSPEVELWNLNLQKLLSRIPLPAKEAVLLAMHEEKIAAICRDGENGSLLYLISIASLDLQCLGRFDKLPLGVSMNADFVAAAFNEGNIEVFRIADAKHSLLHNTEFRVANLTLDKDRNILKAIGGTASAYVAPGKIVEWDLGNFPEITEPRSQVIHEGEASAVRQMTSCNRLVTGSEDRTLRIWNSADWTELLSLRGHFDRIYDVKFDSTENWLATTSNDHTIRFWNGSPLERFDDSDAKTFPLSSLPAAFLLNHDASHLLVTYACSPHAEVWDNATRTIVDQIDVPYANTIRLGVSPDSSKVVGVDSNSKTWFWDRKQRTARPVSPLLESWGKTFCRGMTVEDDGSLLIADGWNHLHARLPNQTDAPIQSSVIRQGPDYEFISCVLSPKSKSIFSADAFHRLILRKGDTPSSYEHLVTHIGEIRAIAVTEDENWVASAGYDGQVFIFDLIRKQSYLVSRSNEGFSALAFTKNGEYLATGSIDGSVRVWHVASRQLVQVLPGHLGVIHQLGWSNQNRLIAVSLIDHKLHIADWQVSTD